MMMDDNKFDVMIDEDQIQEKIAALANKIMIDYKGEEVYFLCVLKGGMIFCSDLMRAVKLPLEVGYVSVSSYGDKTESSGQIIYKTPIPDDIAGKNVIVVEDIVDTGNTLKALLAKIKAEYSPKSLKVASLLFKPSRNIHPIDIHYLGFKIEDKFVVGYGLDYAQKYRNLPFVGVMKNF
jgi:hypoxanthine phosphoribosyltransferase